MTQNQYIEYLKDVNNSQAALIEGFKEEISILEQIISNCEKVIENNEMIINVKDRMIDILKEELNEQSSRK